MKRNIEFRPRKWWYIESTHNIDNLSVDSLDACYTMNQCTGITLESALKSALFITKQYVIENCWTYRFKNQLYKMVFYGMDLSRKGYKGYRTMSIVAFSDYEKRN